MTSSEQERTDAWTDLGNKPFVMPDLETQRILVKAHSASPQMEANVGRANARDEAHEAYSQDLHLSGQSELTDEQRQAVHDFQGIGNAEQDARNSEKYGDVVAAALRRAREERKLKQL